MNDPSDLCTVNISGQSLTDAASEDFEMFHNVVVINAADNLLPLGKLQSLQEALLWQRDRATHLSVEILQLKISLSCGITCVILHDDGIYRA